MSGTCLTLLATLTRSTTDAFTATRLTSFVYKSMALLAASGLLLARHSPAFRGFFSFQNPYSALLVVKHLLVVLMIAIGLFRSLVPARQPAGSPSRWVCCMST